MKKIISLVLVFTLLINSAYASLSTILPEKELSELSESRLEVMDFEDMVPSDYWSFEALTNAVDTGLMQGASGKIRPYDEITRAEIVSIIINASGLGDLDTKDLTPYQADISGFTDVVSTDWFYNQISMAYKLKLINGISSTEISPKSVVTREQVFTILSRFMSLDNINVDLSVLDSFVDFNTVSSWAKPYAAAMVNAGYVSGDNGYLNPRDAITREEFAQLMYNLFQSNYIKNQESANALKNKTINGNLVVGSEGITLEELNVIGDIIIGDGVGNGNVILDHVTITGRLIVRGGGEHSIYLKNSSAKNIIINKLFDGGVRLYADDGSEVSYIEIPDGKDTVIIDCSVENLLISGDELNVVVNQNVENINLFGDNVNISGNGRIDTVSLGKGVTKVSVVTENTNVINLSGNDITVVNREGRTISVSSDESKVVNEDTGTSNSTSHVVKYIVDLHSNGGTSLNSIMFERGASLGDLPVPQKENSIFIGWFTDNDSFENAVANNTQVSSNMDIYAAYINSDVMTESNVQTMTSVMDVATDYVVTILSSDTEMTANDVKAAIIFETITEDSSEFGGWSVTGSDGTYTVSAFEGYTTGCSYSIVLNNEALSFQDENSSVYTYNLSVIMAEPVLNLQLNSTIKFVPVNEIGDVTQNGEAVDSIFVPLYTMADGASIEELYGTFLYLGSEELIIGNQIAIYQGTSPDQRLATIDYTDQPISYVNITDINGSIISYGNSDPSEIIFTPDVLPINEVDDQDGDPNNDSITIAVSKMIYIGDDFAEMGLSSSTTVDIGDFIAFYLGSLDSAETVTYAKISEVTTIGNYYVIIYEEVNEAEVFSSMDMSSSSDLSYEQIDSNMGIEEMELTIQQQVEDSGFAEAASEYLVALAQLDDETIKQVTNEIGMQNFSVTSREVSSTASPKITVKAKVSKNLEHYSGKGLRCEVTVTTVVKVGDNMSLTISGTFVEEIKVKMNIKSKTIWKKKWIFSYIYDYKIYATIDLYNYTYLALDMKLKSKTNEGWSDKLNIKNSIERLKSLTSSIEANDEVREFYELYQDLMSEEHAYFKLFDVNIAEFSGAIDPFFILAYGFKVDFVVSLDANVVLGSEFSYEKATRYSFTVRLKTKTTTSKQTDLKDERYSFNVYAMGELGIRAGIRMTLKVGFIDVRLNSVGISTEVGAYWKIWGFVNYKLNYNNNVTTTKSKGSCYMEVGIYLTTKFSAQVGNGLVQYNKVLYKDSWPLWHAGSKYYYYDFKYVLNDRNDDILFKGDESNYTLPSSVYKMLRMNFKTGKVSTKTRDSDDFKYTIKDDPNHVFSVNKTGVITITPPAKSDIAIATLVIAWKKTPLSFTSVPISRTYELTWDNLANSYIIRFDSNEGNNVSSIKGAYESELALPTPTREGYIFKGWYTDNGTFKQAFTDNKMPAANYKLYAKWTADDANYTVRHYQAELDGSGYKLVNTDNFTDTTDDNVTPAVRDYTGFQAPDTQTVLVAGDSSTVVEYYYTRNEYNLTFILDNGSANIVSSLKYGSEIVETSLFKSGYTFVGWNTTLAETMPAENLSYTAQWSLKTYTIFYDLDGGSVGSNPESFTINSSDITLENPTKEHYIFTGWIGTGLYSEIKTITIQSGATGNRYYTATWKADSNTLYSVYHYKEDLDGNYTILEAEALTGIVGTDTEAQSKSYIGFTADMVVQETIVADETTVIEIEYNRNSYELIFDDNGGNGGSASNIKYDANITEPIVTRTGYVFNGWDLAVLAKMPAEDMTYSAQWRPNTYNVTFNKNATDVIGNMNDQVLIYDMVQNLTINTYERTGYSFIGWNTSLDGSGISYSDNESVSNLTALDQDILVLYAQWIPNTYNVTFNKNADDAIGSMNNQIFIYDVVQNLTTNAYERTSYAFVGWNTSLDGSGISFTNNEAVSNLISEDQDTIELFAQWADAYKVTFNKNAVDTTGSMNDQVFIYDVDQNLTINTYERTGYSFNEWNTSLDGSGISYSDNEFVSNLTVLDQDILVLYAQWIPNTYNITFNKNEIDATGSMNDQIFIYDVDQNLIINTYQRTGYSFNEWNTSSDGSGMSYDEEEVVSNLTSLDQDIVILFAQWSIQETVGIFDAKYSAKYQVFDFIMSSSKINGNAYDPSWGTAYSSGGHQFSNVMLEGRYFTLSETGDSARPIALYMYESDGTPIVKNVDLGVNLYANSLIGLSGNVNLSAECSTSLENLYSAGWEKGLVAVGNVSNLWDEGLMFNSNNGFGYFISGKSAHSVTGSIPLTNGISNPTITQLKAVSDYQEGPLTSE